MRRFARYPTSQMASQKKCAIPATRPAPGTRPIMA